MDKKNAVLISSSETYAKRSAIFLSVRKTVNVHGYSELREPIKMRENCYPLIRQILIYVTLKGFSQLWTGEFANPQRLELSSKRPVCIKIVCFFF